MAIMYKRAEIYKRLDDNTWNSTYEVLNDARDIKVVEGLGKVIDNFSFRISNANNNLYKTYISTTSGTYTYSLRHYPIPTPIAGARREKVYLNNNLLLYTSGYTINNTNGTITLVSNPGTGTNSLKVEFPVIETNDLIKIYQWKDSSWDSLSDSQKADALIIDGNVVNPENTIENSGSILNVTGKSWMDTLFSTFATFDGYGKKPHEILQLMINEQQRNNPNRKVYWHASNPNLKSDGSAFPDVPSYFPMYKPCIEIIEEMSSDKITTDGSYIFYITIENGVRYLRWKPKSLTASSTITEGTQPTDITVGRAQDEIINAIIYFAGKDCYNHGIYYINYDVMSIVASGSNWKYENLSTVAGNLLQAEKKAQPSKWDEDSQGNVTSNFPNAYSYTMKFKQRNSNTGESLGTDYTVANDAQFNQAIRTEAKWQGYELARRLLELWSNPRFKAVITMPRPSPVYYSKGDLINLNLNRYVFSNLKTGFVNPYKLRLKQLTHDFWSWTLEMEEDEETATQ